MNKTQQIRDLARMVNDASLSLDNFRKRGMWVEHNDMHWHGPAPVLFSLDVSPWREILPPDCVGAVDPVYKLVETQLRQKLWYASLGDDRVIEPWVDMSAVYYDDPISMWGVEAQFSEVGDSTVFNGEIQNPDDVYKMHVPIPHMDGTRTLEMYDRARELLDGILNVRMEWRHRHLIYPNFGVWVMRFIGLERFMYWCVDYPDSVNHFMSIMARTYMLHALDMERRGRLTDNHCLFGDMFPFHGAVVWEPKLKDLWVHSDSQEFTLISPQMTDEYLLRYNVEIFSMFGLGSFGCCESLNNKLGLVRTLPNLRRVTISERTDWNYALDILDDDFVYVVRPNLVNTVYVNDGAAIRKELERMERTFHGTHWEINFPGGKSFNGDLRRFHKWCAIAKEITQKGA